MKVRMLVAAEGEYSLLPGGLYDLPEKLARSLVEQGAADKLPANVPAEKPTGIVPAPHHREGYIEFPENEHPSPANSLRSAAGASEPKPRRSSSSSRKPAAKAKAKAKPAARSSKGGGKAAK